jgi:hypothetical protein
MARIIQALDRMLLALLQPRIGGKDKHKNSMHDTSE